MSETQSGGRVQMLDIVRGFSMFFITGGEAMVLALCACFPGKTAKVVAVQMHHVPWGGFHFMDLIFPTFLLISGASFTFSWKRQVRLGVSASTRWIRFVVRTLMLIGLGMVYNGDLLQTSFGAMRFPSVLARIGLGVFLAAVPYVLLPRRWKSLFFPVGLIGYALLFLLCGGDAPYAQQGNWAGAIDAALLPGRTRELDPEGIISTLAAPLTAFIGMMLGDFLRTDIRRKALWIVLAGGLLIGAAYGMAPWVPIVKKLWTSSYVCLAGGWSLLICAVVYFLADGVNLTRGFFLFTLIGVNSLWFYLLPRFFDFSEAGWCIVGGLTKAWITDGDWMHLIRIIVGFTVLWGMVRWIWCLRRTAKGAAKP